MGLTNSKLSNNSSESDLVIIVDDHKVTFTSEDKNLLNCLERNGIEAHYHCRDGFCGACRVTLKQGQVLYPNGEPLAFVGENEILTCCCIPTTNIDINLE